MVSLHHAELVRSNLKFIGTLIKNIFVLIVIHTDINIVILLLFNSINVLSFIWLINYILGFMFIILNVFAAKRSRTHPNANIILQFHYRCLENHILTYHIFFNAIFVLLKESQVDWVHISELLHHLIAAWRVVIDWMMLWAVKYHLLIIWDNVCNTYMSILWPRRFAQSQMLLN